MKPRITAMENLIASDPGGRNIFGLVVSDQLRLAAQSLRLAGRVGIVSGFYIPSAGAGETDGPPGAKVVGEALGKLGVEVDYITDAQNAPLFAALGIEPIIDVSTYLDRAQPTHLVSIERAGRGADGRYHDLRGNDITDSTPPLDELFVRGGRRGLTTIGIGDGGNEIGMGKVFAEALATVCHGAKVASTVPTDFCITAGVSNWGAYGLAGALSCLAGRDLLVSAEECAADIRRVVEIGGAVDGVTHRSEPTVDGLDTAASLRMLEEIRHLINPSPLDGPEPIMVGILGYGETGRAAAQLLARNGHRVCISDEGSVTVDSGLVVAGVETGGHTTDFLERCDLIVASPGVRADHPVVGELRRRGIPVMSGLEMAYQLCPHELLAVTGTVGKRTTVELLQHVFRHAGRSLTIGGNRGLPLAALTMDDTATDPMALAVSSFQLESVVHFRPHIAVLLNIKEAHLDRHRTVAEYVRIKSRVFMNHRPDDILVLPFDDERLRSLAHKHHGRTFFFSCTQTVDRGAWLAGDELWMNVDGSIERLGSVGASPPEEPYPYADNLLAAAIASRLSGLAAEDIADALRHGPLPGAAP